MSRNYLKVENPNAKLQMKNNFQLTIDQNYFR